MTLPLRSFLTGARLGTLRQLRFQHPAKFAEVATRLGGRHAEDTAERIREVAVTVEAELVGNRGEVGVRAQPVERDAQTQMRAVAVEREAGPLAEHTGEVKLGGVHVARDRLERVVPSNPLRQHRLRSLDQLVVVVLRPRARGTTPATVHGRARFDRATDGVVHNLFDRKRIQRVCGEAESQVRLRIARRVDERHRVVPLEQSRVNFDEETVVTAFVMEQPPIPLSDAVEDDVVRVRKDRLAAQLVDDDARARKRDQRPCPVHVHLPPARALGRAAKLAEREQPRAIDDPVWVHPPYKTKSPELRAETSKILEAATQCRRVAPTEAEAIAPALAALHEDAFRAGMALGMLESIGRDGLERSYREAVAALDDRDRALLVAEEDGEILAMAKLVRSSAMNAEHRAEVQRVAVADAARGRGIGRELMAAIEEEARRREITLLWLTTHDGSQACAFYEALGYTKLGVMPAYSRRPDGALSPGAFYYKELR